MTFNQQTGVQFSSPAPYVPFVQWIRTERYERSDSGSSPARRSMPRSFNGRTKVFEAFYVWFDSSPRRQIVLAWCTVHRRTYKPLRSRSEHGLGSTPSASTNAFEAHEDEQALHPLLGAQRQRASCAPDRQAVGSIPTGRTKFWNCGRMVRRSTFNRDGESSILSSSTNETISPASSSG